MKRLVASFLLITFAVINTQAQSDCAVNLESIKGIYTGACNNGKANGNGKSVGTDTYEGAFLNGFPEGNGMYTWKDGHYFIGNFKKGKINGEGKMYYEAANGQDSIITGFWKNDKYVGQYEKPFKVIDQSSRISKLDIRMARGGKANGQISISSTRLGAEVYTTPVITDVQTMSGQYLSKTASQLTKSSVLRVQQIIFPFRARFVYASGDVFEVIFNEAGDYDIEVVFQ